MPSGRAVIAQSGIVLGYGLYYWGSRVRFPVGAGNFLFTAASRTALGPTQTPIEWVRGALSLCVKRPGRETDHSPPSSAEVKNAWSYTSTPQYVFMAWCLVKHRNNFTFYLICYQEGQKIRQEWNRMECIRCWSMVMLIRGPFDKFVDSSYYSESKLCGGEVTVSVSNYLPWQAMQVLQRSTHSSKTRCRPFAARFRRIVEQAVFLSQSSLFTVEKAQKSHGARSGLQRLDG
jgi:hypothetical protein